MMPPRFSYSVTTLTILACAADHVGPELQQKELYLQRQ